MLGSNASATRSNRSPGHRNLSLSDRLGTSWGHRRIVLNLSFRKQRRPLRLQRFGRNGEGEIRTPATLAGRPVFETGAFNHSATSPGSSPATIADASDSVKTVD